MVNSHSDAIGIIFPNSYDSLVPDLVTERLVASIPFAGRYRMVDFVLSSMANSGIDNISLIVRKNYHSLMDHLGAGRAWDLVRKNGGLNIVPPFAQKSVKLYNGRVEALASILTFLKYQKEKYVILADSNLAMSFNFNDLIQQHTESGADVTMAYKTEPIPTGFKESASDSKELYYTLELDGSRVKNLYINSTSDGEQNLYLNICLISRELLIEEISSAFVKGLVYFERDILAQKLNNLNIHAYRFTGYTAHICDMKSYFDENMKLLDDENLDALFSSPVYTKVRDDNPTRYMNGAVASNIMAADGCVIEGEVENSILFRGVKIAKGAKVKNCVLMQDTVVEAGADLEYIITDKKVTVSEGKQLKGTDTFPVYVAKAQVV